MCGIAGIVKLDPRDAVEETRLKRMCDTLRHRGPDDEGFFVDGPVGLGNRRLAIVDLSPAGHQPMQTLDGSACLTYNGEFYNHQRFRRRLEARGVHFRGSSDTETLVYALATF